MLMSLSLMSALFLLFFAVAGAARCALELSL